MAITGNDLLKKLRGETDEDEKEDEKDKEKSSSKLTGDDLLKRHKAYQSADTSGVDQKYIDSFIKDSNAFLTTAEKDHGGLGWGTASSAYESRNTTWQDLNARADTIGAWLYKNRDSIDRDTYDSLNTSLEDIRRSGSSVMDAFKNAMDYYSQWDTEDAYNAWYAEEQRKEAERQAIISSEDFSEYSQKGAGEALTVNNWGLVSGGKNKVVGYRGTAGAMLSAQGMRGGATDPEIAQARAMTEDEANIYSYFFAKYGEDKANEYFDSLKEELNKRIEGTAVQNMMSFADEHPVWASAMSPMITLSSAGEYVGDLFTGDQRNMMASANTALRGTVSNKVDWEIGNWDAFDFVYNTAMSGADSLALGQMFGPAGGVILGLSAAASATNDALDRGLSKDKAFWNGITAGVFEGLFETISIGNFNALKEGAATSIRAIAKNIGKSMLVNASEEILTEIANVTYDLVANGELSNYALTVNGYIEAGMSEAEAKRKAALELAGQVVEAGASGALMGFGFGTIGGAVGAYNVRQKGANLKASGVENVTALADLGKTFADGTVANRLGNKVGENSSAYDVGRLLQEVGGSLSEQNISDVASELQAKGMSAEEAMKTAKWLYKAAEGGRYSKKQQKAYLEDERISEVHRDLFTNEENSVNKRNTEYEALYALAQEVTKPKSNVTSEKPPSQAEASAQEEEIVSQTENAPTAEKVAESKFEASETGKTTYNGNEVKIQGIASIDNGEVMVQLDNGEVVNARDVEFSTADEALIYEATANMDADTANDFIKGFNDLKNAPMTTPQSAYDYMLGFNEARTYGELGIPYEAMARDGQYANALIGNQAKIAYNRGKINGIYKAKASEAYRTSSKANQSKTPRKYEGETHISEIKKSKAYKSLSDTQKAGIEGMTSVYKALGINVYFFESPTDSKGNRTGKNGNFNPSDNSVHIDLYAGLDGRGLILFTGGHELTHYIRANLPAKFKAFADILFEQYEANGTSVASLIAKKRYTLEKKGHITPDMTSEEAYDLAYEEVVADACEAMLGNGEAFAQISEKVKAKDEGLWNTIKKFFTDLVARIKAAYAELSPDSVEGQKVAEMLETATDLQKMWVDMLVEASEVHGVSMEITANDAMTGTDVSDITKKPVQKLQERTEYQEFPKEMIKITSSGAERSPMDIEINGKKFVGSASVRALRNARFIENGFAPKHITKVNEMLDKMRDYLTEARVKYTYVGLTDVYDAKIIISPTTGQIVLSGLVNNGDYEINFDFTKTCKKRIALQDIIEQLAREKGRIGEDGIQTEVDLSEENIRHINEVLAANGIETACLCCFVDSKRYAMQAHFQEKVCDVWNRLVDEVNAEEDIFKEAPYFDFAESDVETSKIPDEEYDKLFADVTRWRNYKFEDDGEGEGAIERKMKAFLINTPAARKKLRLSDFITEAGRTNLHKLYPDIESLAKAKIGTALPKAVESFAPYNGEIELLGVSGKEDLATYVKNIAGARSQSFSDFIMAHVYDVLQKTASLTARKLTAHTYTKEISRARLFGMTGEKTNLSVLHEIDPDVDSWNAGFKADGSYFVSDYDAFRNKLCNQIQSIPDRESIALQNDPRYSRDCGRIGVGFSYNHMLKMHNDPDIRQVIGYHTSSLPAAIKPLTNLDKATDYTPVQNTLKFKGFKKPNYVIPDGVPSYATPPQDVETEFKVGKNGKPTKTRMSKYAKSDATFDIKGKYEELCQTMDGVKAAKETLRQLLQFASDNGLALETSKYKNGHADFDLYGDTEATQNPYLSADNYIEYCISRGLVPMFYEFALNDNYYKDIYDFNVFDRLSYNPETGLHEDTADRKAYAPQVPVHMMNEDGSMAFPEDFWNLVDKYMKDYNYQREDFAKKFPKIMQEVRSIKDSSGKPMISKQGIKNSDRASDHSQAALEEFGTTTDYEMAGFVLADGRMLKMSQYGQKGVQHKRIESVYADAKGDTAVNRFIQEGNVRIKATAPGIEIGTENAVSTRQFNAISRFISTSLRSRGRFYLDITDTNGNEVASVEYDDRASASDIVYDIKKYYERGRVPNNDIRYSDRDSFDSLYDESLTIQGRINELTKAKKDLESSDEYNNLVLGIVSAKDKSESARMLNEYKSWLERTKYSEIADEIKALQDKYTQIRKAMNEAADQKNADDERKKIEKSGLSDADYFRKIAIKEFGYTPFFYDAGYLLPNGKLLNFSGEKGQHFGSRGQDHRAIGTVYANVSGGKAMLKFMSEGNIRVMAETPGLDISSVAEPTSEQYSTIKKFVREYAKEKYLAVDITDANGNVVGTYEYENNINADRVVNDIKYYFQNGSMREQSSISKFLYSERDPDAVSNRSLLANALESVAQNDIERNKLKEYKGKIALIESEQAKLADTKAKIKELSFAKGRRDTEAIKKLQFEANQTANRINTYDRQLLNLEATAALKGVLQREKQLAYKKAEKEGKEALAKYREKAAKTQRELLTRYQESRKKGVEGRKKTEMRHKIKNVVNELNQYLLKGTKEKHVPIELHKAVAEALDAVNMDTVNAEERIAKKRDEMLKAKTPEAIEKLAKEIANIREMGGNMANKLSVLKTAYDSIINSDDPLIANSHDDVISNSIDKVVEVIGETPLRDMSLYQLEAVYDLYKMVLKTIQNTNKAFKAEKGESISIIANGVIAELVEGKQKSPYSTKASQAVSEYVWNNLKPVYAFERIGSKNFTKVFNAVRAGEDVWAKDMNEAQAFREAQFKKFKYDSWDFKKRFRFTSTSGKSFELSLDQILSLYAFSKREQAGDHLKYGGFVFDGLTEVKQKNKVGMTVTYQLKDATAYNLSEETLAEIIGKLTPEQREFADTMQDYLSTVMGEKGNEVSLELYDIKLFKEKNYFPLKSAPQYLAKAKEQAQGEVKIKNSGFTKETTPNAKNPIVLSSFMDVWAGHVNEMSMYHAFTLPLEDFYRVYNYHTPADEKMSEMSVGSSLENAHGQAAVKYIDQLLKDLNGGARSDPRETLGKAMMSNFKKAAVMASLSVVVQQPTAIVRATAVVNSKYFFGKPLMRKHKDAWAEVKKYAPVAVIKEMGYFDTGMGKGSVEWLKSDKNFMDKVDDAASKLPALADEITWVAIWNAVKRETVHTHKHLAPNSDAFLKAVGERFTEVITKTQVYDSTLSRSANMRSKGVFMQMLTSFMAEPTTSINMLQDAFHKGNKKYIARTMAAVYGSVILNSALVSIVYAMRDDDDDETFIEKYLSRLTTEAIDNANPLTYLPIVKDIWSAAQGFDIERADMSLITDLIGSFQQLTKVINTDTSDMEEDELAKHKKEVTEAILSITDGFGSLAGIPVKNIRRDINGAINFFRTVGSGQKTTAGSLGDNVIEDLKDSIPVWGWLPDKSKGEKLYDAIIKGDTVYIDRLKSGYKSEDSYYSAVGKIVREHLEDGDLTATEAERLLVNYGGKDEEEAFSRVQYWEFKMDYPDYDLSEEAVAKYYTDVEPWGINMDVYYDYYQQKAECKGIDEDGDGRADSGTKKAEVMELIDSLPISNEQKDALYYLNGWSESTIGQAPWH